MVHRPLTHEIDKARMVAASLALLLVGLLASCGGSGIRGDMPPGWSDDVESHERARLRVVVFSDDINGGEAVLGLLRTAGYTNPENYVHTVPNDDFNLKWGPGGASDAAVDELVAIVEARTGRTLARRPILEGGTPDVFINLPLAGGGSLETP